MGFYKMVSHLFADKLIVFDLIKMVIFVFFVVLHYSCFFVARRVKYCEIGALCFLEKKILYICGGESLFRQLRTISLA